MRSRSLARAALLLALALCLQSIRLILPIPLPLSTFVVGTLVHMLLVVTYTLEGMLPSVLLCLLLPVTAYAQGQLLLPVLIPVVWLGNLLFVFLYSRLRDTVLAWLLPSLGKGAVMLVAAWLALSLVGLDVPAVRKTVLFAMSVPQIVTGVLGIAVARKILGRFFPF